jgi:hypothetical protein
METGMKRTRIFVAVACAVTLLAAPTSAQLLNNPGYQYPTYQIPTYEISSPSAHLAIPTQEE